MFFKKVYGPFTFLLRDKQPIRSLTFSNSVVAVSPKREAMKAMSKDNFVAAPLFLEYRFLKNPFV